MSKYAIVYRYTDDRDSWVWDSDEWKLEVCADFDDCVVLLGNSYYHDHADAPWWCEAEDLIYDIECAYDTFDGLLEDYGDQYAEDKLNDIWDMYQNRTDTDSTEFTVDVVKTLYPNLNIDYGTIHGYGSTEWRDAVVLSDIVDLQLVEDWYFGKVCRIYLFDLESIAAKGANIEDLDSIDWGEYDCVDSGYITESEFDREHPIYDFFEVPEEETELVQLEEY